MYVRCLFILMSSSLILAPFSLSFFVLIIYIQFSVFLYSPFASAFSLTLSLSSLCLLLLGYIFPSPLFYLNFLFHFFDVTLYICLLKRRLIKKWKQILYIFVSQSISHSVSISFSDSFYISVFLYQSLYIFLLVSIYLYIDLTFTFYEEKELLILCIIISHHQSSLVIISHY